jgi:hypothetical protein
MTADLAHGLPSSLGERLNRFFARDIAELAYSLLVRSLMRNLTRVTGKKLHARLRYLASD